MIFQSQNCLFDLINNVSVENVKRGGSEFKLTSKWRGKFFILKTIQLFYQSLRYTKRHAVNVYRIISSRERVLDVAIFKVRKWELAWEPWSLNSKSPLDTLKTVWELYKSSQDFLGNLIIHNNLNKIYRSSNRSKESFQKSIWTSLKSKKDLRNWNELLEPK